MLPIHFCGIRALKVQVKNAKKVMKINFRILKEKKHAYFQTFLKSHVKFQKDRP